MAIKAASADELDDGAIKESHHHRRGEPTPDYIEFSFKFLYGLIRVLGIWIGSCMFDNLDD